jgi:hypothetical protein
MDVFCSLHQPRPAAATALKRAVLHTLHTDDHMPLILRRARMTITRTNKQTNALGTRTAASIMLPHALQSCCTSRVSPRRWIVWRAGVSECSTSCCQKSDAHDRCRHAGSHAPDATLARPPQALPVLATHISWMLGFTEHASPLNRRCKRNNANRTMRTHTAAHTHRANNTTTHAEMHKDLRHTKRAGPASTIMNITYNATHQGASAPARFKLAGHN